MSASRSDGTTRRQATETDGVALEAARKRKERAYPELVGPIEEHGWLCWPLKLVADGRTRRVRTSANVVHATGGEERTPRRVHRA